MLERRLDIFGSVPFSHGAVLPLLEGYRRPNDKIAEWLKQGVLVPLKRGLYVLGSAWREGELSLPLVANRLYGPSCISLDYALSWHGLVPERVHELTSVCMRRGCVLENALGRFSYATLPRDLFSVGMQQVVVSDQVAFLMAGPEKALCDKVLLIRNLRAVSRSSMQRFLLEDLRLDEGALGDMDLSIIKRYADSGRKSRQMRALLQFLEAHS